VDEGLYSAATVAVGSVDQTSQLAQIHKRPRRPYWVAVAVEEAADEAARGRVVKDAVKLLPLFQTPLIGAGHHSRIVCENVTHNCEFAGRRVGQSF